MARSGGAEQRICGAGWGGGALGGCDAVGEGQMRRGGDGGEGRGDGQGDCGGARTDFVGLSGGADAASSVGLNLQWC